MENDFHSYSIPRLPLPSEENGWEMSYELKCGQLSSPYLIAASVQRQTELIFKKLAYVLQNFMPTNIRVIIF